MESDNADYAEEENAYEEEDEDVYSEEERAASSKVVSDKVKPESPPADRYEANLSPDAERYDYGGEESSAKPSAQASARPSKLESQPDNTDSKMESSKGASQRPPPAVQSQGANSVDEDVPDYSDEDEYKDD